MSTNRYSAHFVDQNRNIVSLQKGDQVRFRYGEHPGEVRVSYHRGDHLLRILVNGDVREFLVEYGPSGGHTVPYADTLIANTSLLTGHSFVLVETGKDGGTDWEAV